MPWDSEGTWYDEGSEGSGTIYNPDGTSTDYSGSQTFDDGSVLYTDADGNPVSVTGSNGVSVSPSDVSKLLQDGKSVVDIAKQLGITADAVSSLAKSAAGLGASVAQVKWFTDMKDALDKSRTQYEGYLAQLDSLKDQLGSLNSSDRTKYDTVRNAVAERISTYRDLSDKAASSLGNYNAQSMNDFMGAIAQYGPQTYQSLMGDIQQYSPQTYQSLMGDIEQYNGVNRSDMQQAMGQFQFFDPTRVSGRAGEIAATKTAALDRLFDRANSTGYANTISRGVDRSSLEDLRRSDVIQKFAPEYMSIDNDSFKEALAQESGLFQQYLTGRNAYTAEQTAMDNLERSGLGFALDAALKSDANERAGLGFALDSALKADANERAGLGFLNQSAIASDAASRASRLQPYTELAAQVDPSLKYGSALMGSDQTMSRNTLSNYTDLAKRLTGTAAGTYNTASNAYGKAYGDLVTALNSYAKSGGGSTGSTTTSSGGGGGGGSFIGDVAKTVGTVGSIVKGVGAIASFFSSEDMKEGKRQINVDEVLDAIKTMPVESWQYKEGVADGGEKRHIGPYAGDFAKRFGGNGVTIDGVDAFGVSMAGIQGLARKVDNLEKRVNRK